jgi:hypothetical protein
MAIRAKMTAYSIVVTPSSATSNWRSLKASDFMALPLITTTWPEQKPGEVNLAVPGRCAASNAKASANDTRLSHANLGQSISLSNVSRKESLGNSYQPGLEFFSLNPL